MINNFTCYSPSSKTQNHPEGQVWAMTNYLVFYTVYHSALAEVSQWEEGEAHRGSTAHTRTPLAPSHTLFFALFHFPLIIHFLNGCLDGLLVAQELVRPNGMQVLIQLQQNGNSSGQRDVDNVLV